MRGQPELLLLIHTARWTWASTTALGFVPRGRVGLGERRARLCTKTAAALRGSLRMAGGLQDIHAHDQSALEPISMADLGVGEELAGLGVVNDLVDADRDAPI